MIKKIYNYLPFKRQIFTFIRSFVKLPTGIYQHLHFKGIFSVKLNEKSSFLIHHFGYLIENEIFWAGIIGGWEKESLNLWIQLCKDSNNIIDVGANTGVYSLIAKSINPNAKVIALEPVERVYKKLLMNTTLNNYDITCLPLAASNKDGEAIIFDIPNAEHTYSVTVNKNMYDPGTPIKTVNIRTIKLDTLVEEQGLPKIDLIKIDVETHEAEVIEGYLKYISIYKPTILIEILTDEVGQKVEEMISNLNYLYFNIDENNGIRKVDKILKSDYYNYLLCSSKIAEKLNILN